MIDLEERVIQGIKDRNSDIIEDLIDKYSSKLKRVGYLILNDEKLAEDAVQETFMQLIYNIHQFKGQASLYTYLYKILVNQCRQKTRKSWFKKVTLFDRWSMSNDKYSFEEEKIDKLTISQCIKELDTKYREVILLYYYEDMSIDTICTITGEKAGTIKSRLKRGRDMLKEILKEEGYNYEG